MLNGIAAAWASLDSGLAWGILGDGWLKGLLILSVTWLSLRLAPRKASATRHLAWCLAMASLLLLPLLSWVLPGWHLPVLPARAASGTPNGAWSEAVPSRITSSPSDSPFKPLTLDGALTLGSGVRPPGPASTASQPPQSGSGAVLAPPAGAPLTPRLGWRKWAVAVWAGIAVLLLISAAFGQFLTYRLFRRSRPVSERDWQLLASVLAGQLGIHRRIELRQCDPLSTPVTWGWWRPAILLPRGAGAWPEAWRRAVLVHELAHVQRWDCFTQTLAHLAGAMHWPNPLVWLAARRMGLEREQACDDLVLNAGSAPADYAGQLLEITRGRRHQPYLADATIAMARPSTLERRVRAILDRTRNRRGLTRALLLAGLVLMAAIAAPTAAIKLIAKSPPAAAGKTTAEAAYARAASAPSPATRRPSNPAPAATRDGAQPAANRGDIVGGQEYLLTLQAQSEQIHLARLRYKQTPAGTVCGGPAQYFSFHLADEPPQFSRMLVEQQLARAVARELSERRYGFAKVLAALSASSLQVGVTIEGLCAQPATNGLTRQVPLAGRLTAKYAPEIGRYQCRGEDGLAGVNFEVPVFMDIDMQIRADALFKGNAEWDLGLRELHMNLEDRTGAHGYAVSRQIILSNTTPAVASQNHGLTNATGK